MVTPLNLKYVLACVGVSIGSTHSGGGKGQSTNWTKCFTRVGVGNFRLDTMGCEVNRKGTKDRLRLEGPPPFLSRRSVGLS